MPDPAGKALQEAIAVMDTLRSEGGCPWDREQTHASLAPYAVEEAHEVAEAAESGDREELIEELGDLLLQVLFHARVGAEEDLEQQVAQFFDQLLAVTALGGFGDLVGFFDGVGSQ